MHGVNGYDERFPTGHRRADRECSVPFTGSHPAAVLPFCRVLVPAALVIGSMVPDLPYYVPSPVSGSATHTVAGSRFDLLVGLVAFIWRQAAIAPVARSIAPVGFRARLTPATPLRTFRPPGRVMVVFASLAIGIGTHIVWDEFTHRGRWGARHISWLAASHSGVGGYEWLQYASGVLGMVVIVVTAARWWVRTVPAAQPLPTRPYARPLWLALAAGTLLGMLVGFTLASTSGKAFHPAVFDAARGGGGAALLVVLVAATVIRLRQPPVERG